MGVDQTSLDRIRNATFPTARRGYDKQEVEKFLGRLADWLETGGGDEYRSETVKGELERVGERTGAILAQAEESAQQIRSEAESLAREAIDEGNAQAQQTRQEADSYARQTRADAEADAREAIADAKAQARRIVEEGTRRREDIEAVIADLVRRRDEVLDDTDELAARLNTAVTEHRPTKGADPFDLPAELDPEGREPAGVNGGIDLDAELGLAGDGGGLEGEDGDVFEEDELEPLTDESELEPLTDEPELPALEAEAEAADEELEAEPAAEAEGADEPQPQDSEPVTEQKPKKAAKPRRRRTRKVGS